MTTLVQEREVRVRNNGASFKVKNGECILDAALSQGVQLPHQCRGASCGECKSRVHVGTVDHGWSLGFAITDQEKAEGLCLACQAKPLTDVVEIETLRPVGGSALPAVEVTAKVVSNVQLTPRVMRLVLAPEGNVKYEAGSYAELVLPGVAPNRVYSFGTPARDDGLLEFFVALHPHGMASGYVHSELQIGDRISVKAPFGSCRMPDGTGPVVGLAGGTGLAPVLAIFEESLASGEQVEHVLAFSVREDAEVFALERMESLARTYANFSYALVVTDAPSRHCAQQQFVPAWVRQRFKTLAGHRAVIGGSPRFVQACQETCLELGMQGADLATDSFVPQKTSTGDKR